MNVGVDPLGWLAVALSVVTVVTATAQVVRPARRLAGRVRPYTTTARTSLGRAADVRAVASPGAPVLGAGTLRRLFGPILEAAALRVGHVLDSTGEDQLRLKLRQGGLFIELPESQRVLEYRVRQLASSATGAAVGVIIGAVVGDGAALVLALGVLGFTVGATRHRGQLDTAIEDRRARMRIELYTINQLLAMNVRVGGGVIQAVRRIVDRGNGAVVDELAEVLRAHASGVAAADAFGRAARQTPEPTAARTYRILASGAEYGADLAEALLAHSEDVREARREAIRRNATRRRAAMLLPIIAVLAPVMLLFIAAPIPSLVFGAR